MFSEFPQEFDSDKINNEIYVEYNPDDNSPGDNTNNNNTIPQYPYQEDHFLSNPDQNPDQSMDFFQEESGTPYHIEDQHYLQQNMPNQLYGDGENNNDDEDNNNSDDDDDDDECNRYYIHPITGQPVKNLCDLPYPRAWAAKYMKTSRYSKVIAIPSDGILQISPLINDMPYDLSMNDQSRPSLRSSSSYNNLPCYTDGNAFTPIPTSSSYTNLASAAQNTPRPSSTSALAVIDENFSLPESYQIGHH